MNEQQQLHPHKERGFRELGHYGVPYVPKPRKVIQEDENEIIYEDGVYHKSNKLNNLLNKEWLKFQKSWFVLNPKPRQENVLLHPAKFPEELAMDFIQFFTKIGQTVLDPMLGTGSTLLACAATGRNGIGIELQEKYASIALQRVKVLSEQKKFDTGHNGLRVNLRVILGDARDIQEIVSGSVDYCITSPPYWDMLLQKGFETQRKRRAKKLDVYYSEDPRDLGNFNNYDTFLEELVTIYERVSNVLKPGGYMTIVVKNIKKGNKVYPLSWDIGKKLSRFLALKDEKIWCQNDVKLAPYGYRNAWVSNTVHHYCLNFRKQ
jgi:DNA modification methylase